MPFTPFHLGPGALLKAAAADRFSFMVFGGSQVLMDVEPLVRMIRGDSVLHGLSHTVVGAFAIGAISAAAGRPIGNFMLRYLAIEGSQIRWSVAILSAFLGTYSHIVLDALMHRDMNPLWPFSAGNAFVGAVSIQALHVACVAAGIVGGLIIGLRALRDA